MEDNLFTEPSKTLSKFFTFNENSLQALSEPYLWFSNPEDFNDPFEGKVSVIYPTDAYECIDAFDRLAERGQQPNWRELSATARKMAKLDPKRVLQSLEPKIKEIESLSFKTVRESSFCCLFNEDDKKEEDQNILMWSHYGNGLKGFKVEFDSSKLVKSLPDSLARLAVSYSDDFPVVKMLDLIDAFSSGKILDATILTSAHIGTKQSAWKYEKEYRFISHRRGEHAYDPASIKTITFGEKMPAPQRKVLMAVTKSINPNIEFFIATRSVDSYRLLSIPVAQ